MPEVGAYNAAGAGDAGYVFQEGNNTSKSFRVCALKKKTMKKKKRILEARLYS